MARRIPPVNGVHTNGDVPPPSTLAAQIVQNQSRAAVSQQNGERATFAQLLQEILHDDAATPETDVSVNVKLINVVAEAGLSPLADHNPLAQWDALIPLAVDSIAVIGRTIKRQPEVLFTPISPDGPQLLLPLIARLVAVCGRPECNDLPVVRLLNTASGILKASLELWQYAQTLRQVLQECIDDVISNLEMTTSPNADFSLKIPAARSVAVLSPQSAEAITLPHGCQTSITDASHAFMLALKLSEAEGLSQMWCNEFQLKLARLCQQLRPKLENSKQWEPALHELLASPSCAIVLDHVIRDATKLAPSTSVQLHVAKSLVDLLRRDSNAVRDSVLNSILSLIENDIFETLHEDLKIAVTIAVCRLCERTEWPERVQALHEALRQNNVMTDTDLLTSFKELTLAQPTGFEGLRRRKRRKVNNDDAEQVRSQLILRTTRLLTGVEANDLTGVAKFASNAYVALGHDEQCVVWQSLIDLASAELQPCIEIISNLIELPQLDQMERPRVLSMLAIQSCIVRTTDPNYLDLRSSTFGQLCLRSLHSSVRELRIAAGQCLPCFLHNDLPQDVMAANRKAALEYLRVLSDRDAANEHETLIGVWGAVAKACDEAELNLVLLQLVDYLGHSNPLIYGLASLALEKLAASRDQSIDQLLRPFWSSIAVSVTRDLQSRPQKVQQLCELLSIDVNAWLVQTQQYTIPHLVLARKKDVLQRIASARGNNTSIEDICLQPRTTLAATMALLLAQTGLNTEEVAMASLEAVSPAFRGRDISDFVKGDPSLIACCMLKHIGDQTESKKSRAYQAFLSFANIAERQPGSRRAHSKSSRAVSDFFDVHILGIMAHFSEVLENVHPIQEKLRCIKAMSEMVVLNKERVNVALPQIRAALQSAMEQPGLCEAAFATWMNLLSVLHGDDVAHVLDQSFVLILRHWAKLSSELQHAIHDGIAHLVKTFNHMMQENVMSLPSLKTIPLLAKIGGEIDRLKSQENVETHFKAFAKRLRNENRIVVVQALQELVLFLEESQASIHEAALSEQPAGLLSELIRGVLDVTALYSTENEEAADLCGKALGVIGCIDPNRLEAVRKKKQAIVLSNFDRASETVDWAIVLLEEVLVKAFKSVNNARLQGFLAYVLQELLRFCEFNDGSILRPRASQPQSVHQKWMDMPEHVRITLTPFVRSRYHVVASNMTMTAPNRPYPNFSPDSSHSAWLRSLVYDLMWKAKGDNAKMVFPLLARLIRNHDLAIASFMLPYTILNVVLGGIVEEVKGLTKELVAVLGCEPKGAAQEECVKLCSESVFNALDYMSTWLREKRKALGETRIPAYRTGHSPNDFDESTEMDQIDTVEKFLASIPAESIATQAMMCGSFSRALFHWEQYIRSKRPLIASARPFQQSSDDEELFDRLQYIYSQIDEPDGLEGISAHVPFLNEEQQAMQHVKAGRWTAAQAWFESQLAATPQHVELEETLMNCLRETGRYAPLIRYADSFVNGRDSVEEAEEVRARFLPAVVEAQWMIGDLDGIKSGFESKSSDALSDFNVGIASVLGAIMRSDDQARMDLIKRLRGSITQAMTVARTGSIQASHEDLKKLHVLYEIEALSNGDLSAAKDNNLSLERRLSIMGSYVSDKQYILGIRRAVTGILQKSFQTPDIGSSWLTTAKLARQLGNTQQAYDAVLQAYGCDDRSAKLEEVRLLWHDGHQRHAIHSLESAISSGIFENMEPETSIGPDQSTTSTDTPAMQNMLSAKASLLLAKWLDASGQTQSKDMTEKYQFAARHFQQWEKGHYYLGKHYQKLFEAEKALPKERQSSQLHTGEYARLVIENQLRAVPFGNKYWHQIIPKILTLWLDLGSETIKIARGEDQTVFDRRVKSLQHCNKQLQKYIGRVPPYVFYSALAQMISRITHQNPEIWKQLRNFLVRVVSTHPNQALWSLLAVTKASDRTRVERGTEILSRLKDQQAKSKQGGSVDLRVMITQGQKLSDGLLHACEAPVDKRDSTVSLSKILGFNHKLAPNPLVVPIELTLTPIMPSGESAENIRRHQAFVQDRITIQSFTDSVLVLSSLQRPRKLTVRGSDGKLYGLLCKPKDDLRKDQRLMEFNGVINRALKRDAESSKRRLYIKTYAVTPLSEESGIIEWVEGIKPIRDILLSIYARKAIRPNYTDIRQILDEASAGPQHAHIFLDKVLPGFPASLHEWFTEVYPEPDTWFAARLRYTRSAAVMSMTGHVLGLGDRHGENILLEESTGGVFHVDFNCLFDKGLTFEKPELVPFRLTHNMVDAMGPYGSAGPFRKSSELTMRLLRQSKDTLMTVLETFLYDPTTDFVGKKKKSTLGVPETPGEILESVDGKLKGMLRGERVPLGVEGYVDALIREATSPFCLASMYIGWCAFL